LIFSKTNIQDNIFLMYCCIFVFVCSDGLSYCVNVALWNAVQFLFPREVESRKAIDALSRSKKLSAQPYKNSSRSLPPLNDVIDIISCVMLALLVIAVPYMTYVVFEKDFR
jgi:hypothetical protein